MSMQQLSEAQANPEVPINENFETLEHQSVYGKDQTESSDLTWGYYGGRWGGFSVSDGTLTLSASSTNYVVVAIATGVISVSTSNTNWNDTDNYVRVYKLTTSASAVTATEDHRAGPGGVHGGGGGAGGSVDLTADVTGTLPVANGGTGRASHTAYAVVCGGTTSTAAQQSIASVGTSGQVLTSNGAGALPTFQTPATGGDASTNTATSVDSEVALFSGTGGKTLKRATGTGFVRLASGVQSTVDGSNDDFAQRKSGVWTNRTVAQVSSDLQGTGLITDAVGFRTLPQNSQSANYTTVAADSGKHLLHPSSDANARTFTIDSNANVAYPIGTAITFINQTSQVLSIAITSDTLTLANSTTTGTRSLAQNGVATAIKVASTSWIISGSGLT